MTGISKMKKAVLYLIFICLLAPNAFRGEAFSQSEPSDEGTRQAAGDSVDSESADKDVPPDEGAAELQPSNSSTDAEAASAENPERKSKDLKKLPQARDDETPPTQETSTDVSMTSGYRSVSMYPFAPTSPRPPSGNGYIIPGSILLGMGASGVVGGILILTVFRKDSDGEDIHSDTRTDTILTISLIGSGVLVAIGIPLLIIGLDRRSELIEWQKKNPGFAGLDFQFSQHEVITSWKAAF